MGSANRNVLSAVGILAILLVGPAVPTNTQERGASVIRSTTRLVQFNVEVLDKQGKAVSGLSRDDFQVLDNGSEQKLSHFSASAAAVPRAASDTSPLEVSNRPQQGSEKTPGITVILVDELVLQDGSRREGERAPIRSARLAVLQFLATLQPGEQVALYALRQEGVVVIHDLTDDPAGLIAAAKALGTGLLRTSVPIAGGGFADARSVSSWLGNRPRKEENREDLQRFLVDEAFQAIAHHLQGTPGRKNIVMISTDFPSLATGVDPELMTGERDAIVPIQRQALPVPNFANTESEYEEFRDVARRLSNANISVYPMDAKALATPLALGGGDAGANEHEYHANAGPTKGVDPKVQSDPRNVALNSTAASIAPPPGSAFRLFGQRETMELLASETGGRAFYDTNALDQHLREVLEEGRVTYLLGYYPGDSAWDGKYHHVEVKLKRPGLTVRCRKGYFATDEPLPQDADIALREVARSMLDWSGMGVTLIVSSNPLEWSEQDIGVKLDTREIHFQNSGGRWRAQIDMAFAQLAGDGRILENIEDHVELALEPDTYEEAAVVGYLYPKTVSIKPEAEKLRVVVRDQATGAVGSVSVPVRHDKGT
jgi:VWFA-related protein